MSVIQFIGAEVSANAAANVASRTINKPGDTQDGDLMLAFIFSNDQVVTAPAGWAEYENDLNSALRSRVYWKIASGEGSSYDFTVPTGTILGGAIASYRHARRIHAHRHATSTTADPVTTAGPIFTGIPCKLLYYTLRRDNTSTPMTYTTSAAATARFDHGANSGAVAYSHALFEDDEVFTAAGEINGISISDSATPTHGHHRTIAICGKDPVGSPGSQFHVTRQAAVRSNYW